MTVHFDAAPDRQTASASAARLLAAALEADLAEHGSASLVASGGSSPLDCFRRLSKTPLAWRDVTVTLSDERWVPPTDPASNAGMLARELLIGHAAEAAFVPLYRDGVDAETACPDVDADLRARVPMPFSATLLGMGADGHFASLFPDAPNVAAGLALDGAAICIAAETPASPVPRISLTLPALLASRLLLLLMFGDDKRAILERAADGDTALPVTRLLAQNKTPVHILWAP